MNDAQNAAFQARQAISRFRTELADVSQLRVPDLQVGEFTSFADYFFDGLFVDLYIQDKIGTARRSAEETAAQVEDLLSQLRRERDRTAERAAELEPGAGETAGRHVRTAARKGAWIWNRSRGPCRNGSMRADASSFSAGRA